MVKADCLKLNSQRVMHHPIDSTPIVDALCTFGWISVESTFHRDERVAMRYFKRMCGHLRRARTYQANGTRDRLRVRKDLWRRSAHSTWHVQCRTEEEGA